jgi:hypothetical protein
MNRTAILCYLEQIPGFSEKFLKIAEEFSGFYRFYVVL